MADEVVRVKKVKKVKKVTTVETSHDEAASETGSNYDASSRNPSQGDVGLLTVTHDAEFRSRNLCNGYGVSKVLVDASAGSMFQITPISEGDSQNSLQN